MNRLPCFICNERFRPGVLARIDGDGNAGKCEIAIRRRNELGMPPLAIDNRTRLCVNCNRSVLDEIARVEQDPNSLRLNVLTQTANSSCIICNAVNNLHRLTMKCRVNVFVARNIYIPESVRSCVHHIDNRGFILAPLMAGLRFVNRPYVLGGQQLQLFLHKFRNAAMNNNKFEDEDSFTDTDFQYITSLTKEQFRDMFALCDRAPCQGGYRYINKKDLVMFLCKMRQGLSDEYLKVIFQYSNRQVTSLAVATVRQSLMLRIVPQNIGFDSITREEFIARHVTEFANELYNPTPHIPVVIVCIDGIYSYIDKSSNFRSLRQSYSMHKGRHLVKPALLVAPDGYKLDIHGPYFSDSRNNDAAMLNNEFQKDVDRMREWFPEGSIVVVDRGYRDATDLLQHLGISWKMPALLTPGQRQHSTEEANETRLITKTRWLVEARNGHIKSIFKFLDGTIPLQHVLNLRDFYRIAGAIINKYHPAKSKWWERHWLENYWKESVKLTLSRH